MSNENSSPSFLHVKLSVLKLMILICSGIRMWTAVRYVLVNTCHIRNHRLFFKPATGILQSQRDLIIIAWFVNNWLRAVSIYE